MVKRPQNDTLVIVCVGDTSKHRDYSHDREGRFFDLMVVYFGATKDKFKEDADFYVEKKGFKWQLTAEVAEQYREAVSRYRYIWLPDEDVIMTLQGLREFRDIVGRYGLTVAQPAIKGGSEGREEGTTKPLVQGADFSHRVTRWRPGVLLRYVNFVEVMAPMFSADAFMALLPYCKNSVYGWGLDYGYSSRSGSEKSLLSIRHR